ncbi:hypothetical protein J2Y03_003676 [Neobacillus niacini]|uniref:hypothetical protein n=1 Tax=Neobacillus niacini TaxID=86668 RepID=UPI00285ADFCC|nr:hypothetical protein [Neobacillus niacini]MDR7078623.1 hypothetical protein [Neobacillus niacini]
MKKWLFGSLFAVLMLTGCMKGNDTTNTAYDIRKDNVNPNFMSNRVNRHMGPMSDQNPNFLNLRGTSQNDASNRNNTGRDIDIARDIVNGTDDFRSDSIWINNAGDQMTVKVDRRSQLNGAQRDKAIDRLHKKLQSALPRYTIDIRER